MLSLWETWPLREVLPGRTEKRSTHTAALHSTHTHNPVHHSDHISHTHTTGSTTLSCPPAIIFGQQRLLCLEQWQPMPAGMPQGAQVHHMQWIAPKG